VSDAWWFARGLAVRNPPLPLAPRSVLFLCHGNICRSPFAARLAARLLRHNGAGDVECLSAGFHASPEACSPPEAVAAAAQYAVSLADHRPVPLTLEMIERSDIVAVMEMRHLSMLRRQYPSHVARFVLLPLFDTKRPALGHYRRFNIADPYGRGHRAFEDCYDHIAHALERMAKALTVRAIGPDFGFPTEQT
jgi:protein-tyrosine phosphatase